MPVSGILALFVAFPLCAFQLFLNILALSLKLDLHHLSFEVVWIFNRDQMVLLRIKLGVDLHSDFEVQMRESIQRRRQKLDLQNLAFAQRERGTVFVLL